MGKLIDEADVLEIVSDLYWMDERLMNSKEIDSVMDKIHALPSAQSQKEIAKRVLWTGWKGHRDTRYKCPSCNKPVKNADIYCHRCGQKLMFPHIDWTPYVEGQKQELIVRWDDEQEDRLC